MRVTRAEEVRHAAWTMLLESSAHEEVASACAREVGWTSSPRTWASVLSQWLSPDLRRPLPAWAATVIVRVCVPLGARDRLSPIFAREAFDAAHSFEDMRAPLVKVRPRAKRRARA